MNINQFNPWWQGKKLNPLLYGRKRRIFSTILEYLSLRQIVILMGLRRVGKSTLIYQIINYLINDKKVDPRHIIYFSFDEERGDLEEILPYYENQILKAEISQVPKLYLLLDFVQQ